MVKSFTNNALWHGQMSIYPALIWDESNIPNTKNRPLFFCHFNNTSNKTSKIVLYDVVVQSLKVVLYGNWGNKGFIEILNHFLSWHKCFFTMSWNISKEKITTFLNKEISIIVWVIKGKTKRTHFMKRGGLFKQDKNTSCMCRTLFICKRDNVKLIRFMCV